MRLLAEPWSLFPGVYTEIIDTSSGVTAAAGTTAFIVFMSEKGPDNQLILNSGRVDDFLSTYGNIDISRYGQGQKIAIQYLTYANSLYSIRVTPDHTNCAAMNNIYGGLYGNFQKNAIEMREAAYANIGIATNESGEFEFIHVGPENLGTILDITRSDPPAAPKLNDRYYIPDTGETALGTWAGHEGQVAICISASPVVWSYKELNDTSQAILKGENVCAAVTYESLPSLALWRDYENVHLTAGTYGLVKDIIYELPEDDPSDGDAYLICNNPTDERFAGHEMNVVVYNENTRQWYFEIYNKVFIDADYEFADEPAVSAAVGKRYIISDEPTFTSWVGHERMIAEKESSGNWKIIEIDVAEPEDTEKFQSIVLDQYVNAIETRRMEYKRQNVFQKDVIWTTDMNATFVAYAHRMSQFDDIVVAANPDSSIDQGKIQPFIIFYPLGRGSYYNSMRIDMRLSSRSIHEDSDFDKVLILDIYDVSGGNILKVESFEVSFNPNKKDLSGDSMFIQDVVNRYSNYLRISCDPEKFNSTANFCSNIHSDIELLFAKYKLRNSLSNTALPPKFEHGDDGNIFDSSGNLNQEIATNILVRAYTGTIVNPAAEDQSQPYESSVLDREMVLIDLIFDAGYSRDVKVAILDLIQARHNDCFGIIDLGKNKSAEAAYKARTDASGVGKPFNTPYIAIYEPYSVVYDAYSGRDVEISPVYHAARAYALTDRDYGRWYAPAGIVRGMCPEVKKLPYNLNRETAYQDLFVNYNINPIIQNRDGFVIWGQSTSYLKTSKFQDVNVVRMILRIRRDLEIALRDYIFELNDAETWDRVSSAVNGYMGNLVSQQAIEDYSASVYASDYDITQHRLRVDVMVQPKMVIYQILLSISV